MEQKNNIISENLNNLTKDELIKLLIECEKKLLNKEKINENQTIDIHPTSNVKKMVEDYEENIIHNHPIPMSRNNIIKRKSN